MQPFQETVVGPKDSELNYGLKSIFLDRLNDEQKLRIFDLTTRASRELHRWAARYPLIRRMRVWPLSLSVAAAAPFATADIIINMARMSLWIFTIDDLFDEEIVPFAVLQRRVDRYKQILAGGRATGPGQRDSLALALQDIRDDLSTYPLYEALWEEWAAAATGTLNAMMREHEWRLLYRSADSDTPLPSYQAYLSYAMYSIGGPPVIWTSLISISDSSTVDRLPHLKELERTASICLRLANDLRSYHKEIGEDKINSIVIRQYEAINRGYSSEAALRLACDAARRDIQRGLTRCSELQREARTVSGHPESAIADIARFVCDFYINHDYHTFTTGAGTGTGRF